VKRLILSALLLIGTYTQAASPASITIGTNNWAENIAVANLWKLLLTEQGYPVKLQSADKALLYNGVGQSHIDITFEVWLPVSDKPAFDKVKDNVQLIGPWFDEAKLGLAVPDYSDIESIEQLNNKGAAEVIFGIDAGSSLMKLTEQAKAAYPLKPKILPSSEPAMLLQLERTIKRKEPVVVTLWKPHWVWAKHPLRFLKDPQGVFGESDSIYAIATLDFKEKYPNIERWLQAWKMDDSSLGGLMTAIIEHGQSSPEKGAAAWIKENRSLIEQWIQ